MNTNSTRALLASFILFFATAANAGFPDDFSDVTWIDPNISSFAQTSTISANVRGSILEIQDTRRTVWPARFHSILGNDCCNRSLWIFIKFEGRWYATTFEFMRFGQINKAAEAVNGGQIKRAPFQQSNFEWHPADGEVYGFMTSGMARFNLDNLNVRERSNVSLYRWGVGPTDNIDFTEVPRDARGNPITGAPAPEEPEDEPEVCVEPEAPKPINDTHDFNGTANGVLSLNGFNNNYSAPVTINISDDRSVIFNIGGESVTTEIQADNTYSGRVSLDFSLCDVEVTFSGTLEGNSTTGTANSSACGSIPATFNATYTASSSTTPSFIDQRAVTPQPRTCPLSNSEKITPILNLLLN